MGSEERSGPAGLLAAHLISQGWDELAEALGVQPSTSSVQASDSRRQARLFPPGSSLLPLQPASLAPRGKEPFPCKHGEASGVTTVPQCLVPPWGGVIKRWAKPS